VAPRNLKSLLASIAFPAWCLGHDPSAQILSVSYAQDLADKLARDCRSIVMSPWYRQIFPTRLGPHRQAVQEFITTRQGYRLATSTGGVLTAHGTICRLQRFCGSYDPEEGQSVLDNGLLLDSYQAGFERLSPSEKVGPVHARTVRGALPRLHGEALTVVLILASRLAELR
jgi:hypothetical protein